MICFAIKASSIMLLFGVLLQACAHSGAISSSYSSAIRHGDIIQSEFKHRVLRMPGRGEVLHVYIEGDGRPWRSRSQIALDPTPRRPLLLQLMQLDDAPRLYLGRPCYFGTDDPQCEPLWWTFGRYSEQVVRSMNKALDTLILNGQPLSLIGHSGGGTLAMLMAARRDDVVAVVTLAGNLDVQKWSSFHGYTPLSHSMNPATEPALNANIRQLHYLGAKDHTITTSMLTPTIERQHNAALEILKDVSHTCCWETHWANILTLIP